MRTKRSKGGGLLAGGKGDRKETKGNDSRRNEGIPRRERKRGRGREGERSTYRAPVAMMRASEDA